MNIVVLIETSQTRKGQNPRFNRPIDGTRIFSKSFTKAITESMSLTTSAREVNYLMKLEVGKGNILLARRWFFL
jgi:hypothetical protein